MAVRNEQSALLVRVARGAAWGGASNLLLRFVNIAVMAVVVRLVSPSQFGIFAVAMTVYAVVSSLGEAGLGSVLARRDLALADLAPTLTLLTTGAGVVLAAGMLAGAGPIATTLGAPEATTPVRVLSLAVLCVGIFAVPSAQLAREFRQDQIFLANAVALVPSNVVLVVLAGSGTGPLAFAWARVVAQVIQGLCMTFSATPHYRPRWVPSAARSALRLALPLAGANFVSCVLLNADYALLARFIGSRGLGLYMLAFNVASWSTMTLSGMINSVALPAFSDLTGRPRALSEAVTSALRLTSVVAMPISALTASLATPLIVTVYGSRWSSAAAVLAVLSLYTAVIVPCLVLTNLSVALGRSRSILFVQVVWLALLVPALWCGIAVAGIVGAAVAHIAVAFGMLPLLVRSLRRATGLTMWAVVAPMMPATGVALAAGVTAYVTAHLQTGPWLSLLVGGSAGSLLYMGVMTRLEWQRPQAQALRRRLSCWLTGHLAPRPRRAPAVEEEGLT